MRSIHRVFGVVAIAALTAGLLVACDDDESSGASTGTDGEEAAPAATEIDVELGDLFINPKAIEAPAGGVLILHVTNNGAIQHDLQADGTGTELLDPGESQTIEVGPLDGEVRLICSVPGHEQAGMVSQVTLISAPAASEAATSDHDDGSAQTTAQAARIDPNATPPAGWEPRDPVLQPAPGGTLHQVTFDMTETVIEVAPGVTQELWTFEDQVPGPVLRGKVGDVFEITIVNKGKLGHSIDFHASKVAWNDEMRTLQPGESLVYRFEAKHAGVYMYHCGTAPALHHIGNGMFGALIIDPPGLEPVDREFVFVQSEFYLGPEGQPGDLAKMQQDAWDAVVFNGYVNQYRDAPVRIETGERIRAWVLNAGPSENSSFHVVGTIFDTVYKEGVLLLQPDASRGGAQALDLQPAQGGYVEFTMDEDGLYPIVTHKFSNVGKGALGLFQAGEVAATGGGH